MSALSVRVGSAPPAPRGEFTRPIATAARLPATSFHSLQRCLGNRAVARLAAVPMQQTPVRLARQERPGPDPGLTPAEEERRDREKRFEGTGFSLPWGRGAGSGTWGWGSPETSNLYHECRVAPLTRAQFRDFLKLIPRPAGRRRDQPRNADDVLALVHVNPNQAVAPKIMARQVTVDGRSVYQLAPTHAEMPPLRSAYTREGNYVESSVQHVGSPCVSLNRGSSIFPIEWTMTVEGAQKTREAEEEHCRDIRRAFDLTLGLYASIINNEAAAEREYPSASAAVARARALVGVPPDDMLPSFNRMLQLTRLRDDNGWHTARPTFIKASLDNGCHERAIIDQNSWPDVDPARHSTDDLIRTPAPVRPTARGRSP